LTVATDVADPAQCQAMVDAAMAEFGRVDVLVNNAATSPHFGPVLDAGEAQWDKTFEVNVKGYAFAIKAAVPLMRERGGGAVVNVASVAGMIPHSGLGVYGITKAAVLMLTKTLAIELAGQDIRVNAIAPGLIQTRFSEVLWSSDEARERALATIPQGRLGQVEDLTGAVLYLASDAAKFTTGAVLVIDGGQTLGGGY
jgi:NAD(P)-dependent dehydrogenase (short-subunit alcohol dehydrogenase family)